MSLTVQDVERLQQKLEDEQQDYQIELQEGNILVMGHRISSLVKLALS